MEDNIVKIGSHVGMSGKEMLLGSAKEAVSYGADTFMFYTGAPQNTRRKEIEELNIDPAWEYMKELGYEMKLEESSGDHQWKYWDAKIQDVLRWWLDTDLDLT